MEPGEIYLADFPEAGPHPVVVVSREELNHFVRVPGLRWEEWALFRR
jgi:hypothetical protein